MDFGVNTIFGDLISCSYDGKINVWDMVNFNLTKTFDHHGGFKEKFKLYKNKKIISSSSFISANQDVFNKIKIWNLRECIKTIDLIEIRFKTL